MQQNDKSAFGTDFLGPNLTYMEKAQRVPNEVMKLKRKNVRIKKKCSKAEPLARAKVMQFRIYAIFFRQKKANESLGDPLADDLEDSVFFV
jgi:hypothetical protein